MSFASSFINFRILKVEIAPGLLSVFYLLEAFEVSGHLSQLAFNHGCASPPQTTWQLETPAKHAYRQSQAVIISRAAYTLLLSCPMLATSKGWIQK